MRVHNPIKGVFLTLIVAGLMCFDTAAAEPIEEYSDHIMLDFSSYSEAQEGSPDDETADMTDPEYYYYKTYDQKRFEEGFLYRDHQRRGGRRQELQSGHEDRDVYSEGKITFMQIAFRLPVRV